MSKKKKALKHLGNICTAIVSVGLMTAPVLAVDPSDAASQVIGSEDGKKALNAAIIVAKSKPALSVATGIVCISCIPIGNAAASPALCIACGILFAKTFG